MNNSKLLAFWKDVEEFSVNRKRLEGKALHDDAQKIFDEVCLCLFVCSFMFVCLFVRLCLFFRCL